MAGALGVLVAARDEGRVADEDDLAERVLGKVVVKPKAPVVEYRELCDETPAEAARGLALLTKLVG